MRALSQRGLHANLFLSLLMVTLYYLKPPTETDRKKEEQTHDNPIAEVHSRNRLNAFKDKLDGILRKLRSSLPVSLLSACKGMFLSFPGVI